MSASCGNDYPAAASSDEDTPDLGPTPTAVPDIHVCIVIILRAKIAAIISSKSGLINLSKLDKLDPRYDNKHKWMQIFVPLKSLDREDLVGELLTSVFIELVCPFFLHNPFQSHAKLSHELAPSGNLVLISFI